MRTAAVFAVAAAVVLGVAATDALAQLGTSEVRGKVHDLEGNPVVGAEVTLKNVTNPTLEYSAKSGKKGDFFIAGLLYNEPGEWEVTIRAEGYSPSKIKVESRKSDRTLVGDIYEAGMALDQPHKVVIKAFGTAMLDFSVMTSAQRDELERKRIEDETARLAAEGKLPEAQADPLADAARLVSAGDLEGSIEPFKKAIEMRPDDPERRELYARILYRLERFEEADAVIREALAIAPDRHALRLLLADIYARQEAYDKASAELAALAQATPDDPEVFRRIAWISERKGDTDGAIRANETVVKIAPDTVEAWLALGDLYAQKGQADRSEQAFRKVVDLDPQNAYRTFFNIGVLIENKPDRSEAEERRALEAFQKAVEIKPDYARAHRHLAYALLRGGDLKGARRELERYLELEPGARDASEVKAVIDGLPR